jgi:hypothetical protein
VLTAVIWTLSSGVRRCVAHSSPMFRKKAFLHLQKNIVMSAACAFLVAFLAYSPTQNMEAVHFSETWVNFYRITRGHISQECTLQTHTQVKTYHTCFEYIQVYLRSVRPICSTTLSLTGENPL